MVTVPEVKYLSKYRRGLTSVFALSSVWYIPFQKKIGIFVVVTKTYSSFIIIINKS